MQNLKASSKLASRFTLNRLFALVVYFHCNRNPLAVRPSLDKTDLAVKLREYCPSKLGHFSGD